MISKTVKPTGIIPMIDAININSSCKSVKIKRVKSAAIMPVILTILFGVFAQFVWLENQMKNEPITIEILMSAT